MLKKISLLSYRIKHFVRPLDISHRDRQPMLLERFSRHTQICSSCHRADRVTNQLKQIFVGVAIALAALAIVTDKFASQIVALSASLAAVVLVAVLSKVKTKFERSYTRN